MRAALIDKPLSIIFTDVPEPHILHPDEVKIRIKVTGICGSEVHAYHGTHPFRIPPVVSGHEFTGEIVEIGSEVTAYQVGDRVTIEPHNGCGVCPTCLAGNYNVCKDKKVLGSGDWIGSFGEYIVAPQHTVIRLPDEISDEMGALIEPLAVSMHAVRAAGTTIGDTICIIGCGPIGLAAILCAKLAGAGRIIVSDTLDMNLRLATNMGATHCVNPVKQSLREKIDEITKGNGVDITYLAFGNKQVYDDALHITRRGGKVSQIALMGFPFEINIAMLQQKEMISMGSNMYTRKDFELVRDALADGRMSGTEEMISDIIPIERAAEAMEVVDKKLRPVVKILLKF